MWTSPRRRSCGYCTHHAQTSWSSPAREHDRQKHYSLIKINKKEIKYYTGSEEELSISENTIRKVYCDKNGYVWVGTFSSGLNRIDLKTGKIKVYKKDENNDKSLPSNHINSILIDNNGDLWVGTDKGLARLINGEDEFKVYKNNKFNNYSLVNNKIYNLMQDKNGIIWVGTYVGISKFDPNNNIKYYSSQLDEIPLSSDIIHGIYGSLMMLIMSKRQ